MENRRRHKDFNQIAKSIVDAATGQASTNDNETIRGKAGGLKGGKARADSLTPDRRSEIASKAAAKRWGK